MLINNNPELTAVSGFEALASVTGLFTITGNTQLASCCAFLPIANDDLTPGGTITLSGNKAGCNNKAEIMNDCVLTEVIIDTDLAITAPDEVPDNVADCYAN